MAGTSKESEIEIKNPVGSNIILVQNGQLLGGEGGEGGCLAKVDAEGALVAGVGESNFEGVRGLTDLIGLDGGAGDVLFLIVGGVGSDVFIYDESPPVFCGDGVDGVGADGGGGASEVELSFGEKSHGSSAGSPRLAIGSSVGFCGDRIIADVDLAAIVERTTGGGRGIGLCETNNSGAAENDNSDDEASAIHGTPLISGKSVSLKRAQGKRIRVRIFGEEGSGGRA